MIQILMIYNIPKGDAATRIAFNRKLFNYNIQTHKGKYKRQTKGILEQYEKPIRSCIIFSHNKYAEVKKLCEEFKIKTNFYKIENYS